MIFFLLLFLQNLNDPELVSLGEKVFSKSCAVGYCCLLYTSDAADDLLCVDLGGRRIIKN